MIAALALAGALAGAPSADVIFDRAQAAWEARVVPRYLSFDIPCDLTFLAHLCPQGATANFVVRMSDGRTYASMVRDAGPARHAVGSTLLRGGYIVGPATTPFGFYRRISSDNVPSSLATPSPPPNFAADPLAPPTIAAVRVADRAYTVALAGTARVGPHECYHLTLRPNFDPDHHPLRDLWVDAQSYEIVELAYARRVQGSTAGGIVHYRFEPIGPQHVWTVVHIDAVVPLSGKSGPASVSSDLYDIGFPNEEPPWKFDASLPVTSE